MTATLIVGDVHLGKGLAIGKPATGTIPSSRVIDQFKLLDWIFDTAQQHSVSDIIFTGDICEDSKPDYYLMTRFIQWIKKCDVNNIDVHIISGNHDIKRSGSYVTSFLDIIQSAEISNAKVYKQIETIFCGSVGFTLLPFRDRKSFNMDSASDAIDRLYDLIKYEIATIPAQYDKVLIGHLALKGSIVVGDEFDDEVNELMCPDEIFEGYDYVWMGHVHRPQVRCKSPHIAHIGSLDISDFGETDHQKILILFDQTLQNKFVEIPVPSRPLRVLKTVVEIGEDSTAKVLSELQQLHDKQSLTNAIVKIDVKLKGADVPNIDRKVIQNYVYNVGLAQHICQLSETRATLVVPQEKRTDLDRTIKPKAALKMWAEQYVDSSEIDVFMNMANEVINET